MSGVLAEAEPEAEGVAAQRGTAADKSAGPDDAPPPRAAYRRNGALVGREAFYAAACDPQRSAVVEACAGAGKTWMLVSRIVRALLAGAEPHEILAITFTRRAAGEMRDRLNEWLAHFAAPATGDDERVAALRERGLDESAARAAATALRGLHARVMDGGRPVEIRTFHAWFSQLLGAAPFDVLAELGLQPRMALIEDVDEHAADVFRRLHAAVLRDAALRADYGRLVAARGRAGATSWLRLAWERRIELALADTAGVLETSVEPAGPPDGERWPHPAETLLSPPWRAALGDLATALGRGNKTAQAAADKLGRALQPHDDAIDATDTPEATDAPALFEAVWSALFTEKDTPRKLPDADGQLATVQGALEDLAARVLQHDAWLEHGAMVRLSRVLLAEYAAYKRQRGLADMADLERCALALLGDSALAGWMQERLDRRVRHLLIDEFQDTSPLQWHALHGWLSGYAGAGGGASGQRPPGVFIVGDPKQSIYRFRRAEPKVFDAAREFVRHGLDGVVLACDHTRRNAPGVVAAVNAVFEAATAAGEFEGFRAHTTEVAAGPDAPALRALPGVPRPPRAAAGKTHEAPVWRDTLTTPRHEPDAVLREIEAGRVADAIAAQVAAGRWQPGDIQVLSRKRETLRLVAAALRERRLPCAEVEDSTLMDAVEVRDLVAVLDALVSPHHRLSLAIGLKSPLFGVTDDDLVWLARRAGPVGDWALALDELLPAAGRSSSRAEAAAAQEEVEEPGETDAGDVVVTSAAARPPLSDAGPALRRAAALLAAWRRAARVLPPHDLLDRIVAEGEVMRRVAAVVPAERRRAALAAVDALLAQALLLDGGRYATPYGFVRALKRRVVKAALPAEPGAVQLLTVHGAKGLEARAVFIVDTDPEPTRAERLTLLVDWPVEHAHPLRCAFVASETKCPPSLQELLAHENAARRREELNGLYVAMTRAREHLVISHTEPYGKAADASASWRERLEPLATPWTEAAPSSPHVADGPELGEACSLTELPLWRAAVDDAVRATADTPAPTRRALEGPAAAAPRAGRSPDGEFLPPDPDDDAPQARLGRAVHRTLEWATQRAGGVEADALPALAEAAATAFGVAAGEVLRGAALILRSAACARFYAGAALRWSGNEVAVADADGEPLRIDRLVCLAEAAGPSTSGTSGPLTWWVLDYKLHHAPQGLAAYREQLLRYRAAVRRLQPDDAVRCAFVTGGGELVEIDAGD